MQWHSMFFALSSNPKKANIMQLWSFSHKRFGNSIPLSECHIYLKHSEKWLLNWRENVWWRLFDIQVFDSNLWSLCGISALKPPFWKMVVHSFWMIYKLYKSVLKKCGGWTSRKLSFVLKLNWDFNFNPSFLTNFFFRGGALILQMYPHSDAGSWRRPV